MNRILLGGLAALLLLGGCGPRYQAITFELRSQPPIPVRVEGDEIELPIGIAVSVHAMLESSSNIEFVEEDNLELKSQDRGVLLVEATPGGREFVFVGVAVGETCLSVEVEYEEQECIPVRVVAVD